MSFCRFAWAAVLAAMSLGTARGTVPADGAVSAGAAIYLQGTTGSGAPVQATRIADVPGPRGQEAACVNCHRRSGLGATEGNIAIPPVSGRYLFQPRVPAREQSDLPYVDGARNREPYTEQTLARAIREGVDSDGKPLNTLMPRFALDDADMASLIGYLKTLDPRHVPGVTESTLHFATIITPDADPVKKRGMLDVMNQYFLEKNTRVMRTSPQMRTASKTLYSKTMYMVNRRWQLHVWELTGAPSTWKTQLVNFAAKEPVLAVVSGLGGSNWAPVHEFCEQERMPCIFPNVEVPVDAGSDFYSLYFSKGVLLEAELIGKAITEPESGKPVRAVRQVFRADDSGQPAARELSGRLAGSAIVVKDVVLPAKDGGRELAAAVHGVRADEALVLWLRPSDLAALGDDSGESGPVYASGLMGGLENSPLPAQWRGRTWLAYPFELPDHRGVRLDYPLGWFRIRHIPVVALQVQADTYLACGLLAETLSHMVDTFERDYLVERTEENLEHRIMTGYYPRLSLSEGQRFASKGGYVARFAASQGDQLVALHDWTVP